MCVYIHIHEHYIYIYMYRVPLKVDGIWRLWDLIMILGSSIFYLPKGGLYVYMKGPCAGVRGPPLQALEGFG